MNTLKDIARETLLFASSYGIDEDLMGRDFYQDLKELADSEEHATDIRYGEYKSLTGTRRFIYELAPDGENRIIGVEINPLGGQGEYVFKFDDGSTFLTVTIPKNWEIIESGDEYAIVDQEMDVIKERLYSMEQRFSDLETRLDRYFAATEGFQDEFRRYR